MSLIPFGKNKIPFQALLMDPFLVEQALKMNKNAKICDPFNVVLLLYGCC